MPASFTAVQRAGAFAQIRRFAGLVRPEWPNLSKVLALSAGVAAVSLITPYLGKVLIDHVYPTQDAGLAVVVIAGLLAAKAGYSLLHASHGLFDVAVGTRIVNELDVFFLNHVQRLPFSFFESTATGEIQSRFADLNESFASSLEILRVVVIQGLYVLAVPALLLWLNWELAIVALIMTPVAVAVTTLNSRRVRAYWKQAVEATADFNAFRTEAIANIRLVKTFGLEDDFAARARRRAEDVMERRTRAGGFSWVLAGSNYLIRDLNSVLYIGLGWYFILHQQMSLGTFLAFEAYIAMLHGPLTAFVNLYSNIQQSSVQIARVFEYLGIEREDAREVRGPYIQAKERRYTSFDLQGVSFRYRQDQPVLENIECRFDAGQVTALTGASGCGKSTILQLLPRFRDYTGGRILLDGNPLTLYPRSDLRRHITLVSQDTQLMRGNVWENLVIGRPDATEDDVWEAAELCRLSQWIADLPQRLHTPVAEWGASLSGGQKQRIALARAILRDTPVLLLDEATANLDVDNERAVLDGIFRRYRDRLVVYVTHRPAATAMADRILRVDSGRVTSADEQPQTIAGCGDGYRPLATAERIKLSVRT